ncbi:alcohol dehydrogenase GroES domain protein [Candidatus Vecturithrix granuli]|uniref:Alcohol dehydrogenase GroES domain protein n=1 Tax=Vecturithrix granuli TaxID=1499967 RepID=A0A081C2E2_VECG1|nr:alcohol dehydrogenase GroES domain protein [Candidatus Vecturithrix granuli]
MKGVLLPGQRQVKFKEFPVPEPGHGQVLVKMKASSICGSDIRAIYREHLGKGPEAYQNVIAGHEPCGQIEKVGPGCKRFKAGDRVIIYHISGCGVCWDCRHGYMISCTSPLRAAYGWQRDGGHADYLLAEENTCVALPDALSFVDGALVACGFGTVYEALQRVDVSGRDKVLVTGMGPVGMAAGLLAKAMGATYVVGVDISEARLSFSKEVQAVDDIVVSDDQAIKRLHEMTDSHGFEVSIDCSGSPAARHLALEGTRRWGRCVMVGEGNTINFDVSHLLIHRQITMYGSWVTSLGHIEDLVERLVRWNLHPEVTVSHRFTLDQAEEAYRVADAGQSGKVCIVME